MGKTNHRRLIQAGSQIATALRHRGGWARAFLKSLKNTGNITTSARAAGITRENVYKRMKRHPVFRKAVDAAIEESSDLILQEARRRAIDGVNEPVIYQGELMGSWIDPETRKQVEPGTVGAVFFPLTVKKYSDHLLSQLLKARVPGFNDSPPSQPINVNVNATAAVLNMTPQELAKLPPDELVRLHRQTLNIPAAAEQPGQAQP
jgi:hypothetical protein